MDAIDEETLSDLEEDEDTVSIVNIGQVEKQDEIEDRGHVDNNLDDKLKHSVIGRIRKITRWRHQWPSRQHNIKVWMRHCQHFQINLVKCTPREKQHLQGCQTCRHWLLFFMNWFKYHEERAEDYLWTAWESLTEKERITIGVWCYKKEMKMLTKYLEPCAKTAYSMFSTESQFVKNLRKELPAKPVAKDYTKIFALVSQKWSTMDEADKAPFVKMAKAYNRDHKEAFAALHPALQARISMEAKRRKALAEKLFPKRPRSSYTEFLKCQREKIPWCKGWLKQQAAVWQKLTAEERKVYDELLYQRRKEYKEYVDKMTEELKTKYGWHRCKGKVKWWTMWFDPTITKGMKHVAKVNKELEEYKTKLLESVANRKHSLFSLPALAFKRKRPTSCMCTHLDTGFIGDMPTGSEVISAEPPVI